MEKLQKILYNPQKCDTELKLYYKTREAVYVAPDGFLYAPQNAVIDFETYFNSFSFAKWNQYTGLTDVSLELTFAGMIEITVKASKLQYGRIQSMCTYRQVLSHVQRGTANIPIDYLPQYDIASFSIKVLSDDFCLMSGQYVTTSVVSNQAPNIAIIFTTYNRSDYIRQNLENIAKANVQRLHVYVVDNASNLQLESSEVVTIIPSRNVGGSGGFTRGMIAAIDENEKRHFTHCLLMDDDAYIDSDVLERLVVFLSLVKEEYKASIIAGAMLRKDMPYMQVEAGATWNQGTIESVGIGLDMRKTSHVIANCMPTYADYAAWWFCTIPMEYIRNNNLPLPIFVFDDDVDYGVRNKAAIITLNGICVWHDPFESKKNAMRCYYETRNKHIVNSCNAMALNKAVVLKQIRNAVNACFNLYQYENAEAIIDGIADFLQGPEYLMNLDAQEHNSTIVCRNVKLQPMRLSKKEYDWFRLCCSIEDCDWLHKLVRILSQNGNRLPAKNKIILPLYTTNEVAGYRADSITYFDEIQQIGYVVSRDKARRKVILKKYKHLKRNIKKNYDAVVQEYKVAQPYLTSREQWDNYLHLK